MKTLIACTFASFLIVSCAGRTRVGGARLTSAPYVTSDSAVARLTQARCDREVACDRVGSERDFADRDECVQKLGRDSQTRLRSDLCPAGVDEWRLVTCLGQIADKRCSNPLDDLDEIASCRRGEMCLVHVLPAREPTNPF